MRVLQAVCWFVSCAFLAAVATVYLGVPEELSCVIGAVVWYVLAIAE